MEHPYELYWLAFVLTGDPNSSIDAVADSLDAGEAANPFFEGWMAQWSRRLVIARALGTVQAKLAESAGRTGSRSFKCPRRIGTVDSGISRRELERALLAIDIFPRCALLLTVFEKEALDDTAVLLGVSKDLVQKAKAIGLVELSRNLASKSEPLAAAYAMAF